MSRFWSFGIDQCVRRLLADPATAPHILSKRARTTSDAASFYGSEAFQLLDADCAGALTREEVPTVLLSLGGDGVQLLNWGSRTATVVGIKCEDLPPELVQKGMAVKPLLVIEGHQEPSVLNHALKGAAQFLLSHAPSTTGEGAFCSCLLYALQSHSRHSHMRCLVIGNNTNHMPAVGTCASSYTLLPLQSKLTSKQFPVIQRSTACPSQPRPTMARLSAYSQCSCVLMATPRGHQNLHVGVGTQHAMAAGDAG
jgi:hypothetical protein